MYKYKMISLKVRHISQKHHRSISMRREKVFNSIEIEESIRFTYDIICRHTNRHCLNQAEINLKKDRIAGTQSSFVGATFIPSMAGNAVYSIELLHFSETRKHDGQIS